MRTHAFSVGLRATDRKSGTPTITISSGVATFSSDQDGADIMRGDELVHASGTVYLGTRVNGTTWNVQEADGAAPADVGSPSSVTSIKRSFDSLRDAVHSGTGTCGATALIGMAHATGTRASDVDILLASIDRGVTLDSATAVDIRYWTPISGPDFGLRVYPAPGDGVESNVDHTPDGTLARYYKIGAQLQIRDTDDGGVELVGIHGSGSTNYGYNSVSGIGSRLVSCLFSSATKTGMRAGKLDRFHNCTAWGNLESGFTAQSNTAADQAKFYGCLAHSNSDYGYLGATNDPEAFGCVGTSNVLGDFASSSIASTSSGLASSDTSVPAYGDWVASVSPAAFFMNAGAGDFRPLSTSDTAWGVSATGPSVDGNVLTTAANGVSRAGESSIDVGPFEYYVAPGPPPGPPDLVVAGIREQKSSHYAQTMRL